MKTVNFNQKLSLNKVTVTVLNDNKQQHVKGGMNQLPTTSCKVECDTDTKR